MAATVVPKRDAIALRVSPERTTYVTGVAEGMGAAVTVGVGVGLVVWAGVAVTEAVDAVGAGVAVKETVSPGVGVTSAPAGISSGLPRRDARTAVTATTIKPPSTA